MPQTKSINNAEHIDAGAHIIFHIVQNVSRGKCRIMHVSQYLAADGRTMSSHTTSQVNSGSLLASEHHISSEAPVLFFFLLSSSFQSHEHVARTVTRHPAVSPPSRINAVTSETSVRPAMALQVYPASAGLSLQRCSRNRGQRNTNCAHACNR